MPNKTKKKQGFAVMSREKLLSLSSLGGKNAHASGKAHEWTPETAKRAVAVRYRKKTKTS